MTEQNWRKDRELSWLDFNRRVLAEAECEEYLLPKRLSFLSIFSRNLDEFFRVRIGRLIHRKASPKKLAPILAAVRQLYKEQGRISAVLERQLQEAGYYRLSMQELDGRIRARVTRYFQKEIMPLLTPQILDSRHPFPFMEDRALWMAALLSRGRSRFLGLLPYPKLPRFYFPESGGYLLLDDILAFFFQQIFDQYQLTEAPVTFRVTRSAGIELEGEQGGYPQYVGRQLDRRKRLCPVRLELQGGDEAVRDILQQQLSLDSQYVFFLDMPLGLSYEGAFPALERCIARHRPSTASDIDPSGQILAQIIRHDRLLSYPYESFRPFLRLLREAATHPAVLAIKITLYRLAEDSKVAKLLMEAAKNGKDVTAVLELRARFDEENNLRWAKQLEQAGCRVVFGPHERKVHAKICLITYRNLHGIRTITQIGTGNYHEKTAKQYTDLSLLTADRQIGADAQQFFRCLLTGETPAEYQKLWTSPQSLKKDFLRQADLEIQQALADKPARILIKCNGLNDREIMEKLSEASRAGVRVQLIVRGICCLVPGIPGRTENIEVISIVGQFLEHARLYCFGYGRQARVYLSSADLLVRNTTHRIEACAPIERPALKQKVLRMLQLQLHDNVKAWQMKPDGSYERRRPLPGGKAIHAQEIQKRWAKRG